MADAKTRERGGAQDLELSAPHAAELRDACAANVYVVEYPGYARFAGRAHAEPTEAGVYAAADVARAAVRRHNAHLPLLIFGYSLGTAPATHAAAAGDGDELLVLVAPLLGAMATQLARSPAAASLSFVYGALDMFRTEGAARRVRGPALVCHGSDDAVVPVAHGRRLAYVMGPSPKCVFRELSGATHDDARARALRFVRRAARAWLAFGELGEKAVGQDSDSDCELESGECANGPAGTVEGAHVWDE